MDMNPYQVPSARLADVASDPLGELAGRGARLAAAFVDGLVYLFALLIGALVGRVDAKAPLALSPDGSLAYLAVLALLLALNAYLLHRSGQSVGKRALGIRIVRNNGSRAGLGRSFGLRLLLPWAVAWIPVAGALFVLVDILCIFRGDRRCLHDFMADTRVVMA
jgi:uncharacterized RDD family membrane protein YckC